jgi:hypothetical protein
VIARIRGGGAERETVDPEIFGYAVSHTTPPGDEVSALRAETDASLAMPQMAGGIVESRLLEALVVATRARRVLEIGTLTGVSALSMASRLPDGGTVVTLIAVDQGRIALRWDQQVLRLPRSEGQGEAACRHLLQETFGSTVADLAQIGTAPGQGAFGLQEVWLARRIRREGSAAGMQHARDCLGSRADQVHWVTADVLSWHPQRHYQAWHDRAVFHFLTSPPGQHQYVRVLDAATGQKKWEFDAGDAITASPAIAGGRVVVGSADGRIYCFG